MNAPIPSPARNKAAHFFMAGYFFALPWVSFLSSHALGGAMIVPLVIIILYSLLCVSGAWRTCLSGAGLAKLALPLGLIFLSCLFSPLPYKAVSYAINATIVLGLVYVFLTCLHKTEATTRNIKPLTVGILLGIFLLWVQQIGAFSFVSVLHNDDPAYWSVYLNRGSVVLVLFALALFPHLITKSNRFLLGGLFLLLSVLCFMGESGAASLALIAGLALWLFSHALGSARTGMIFFAGMALLLISFPFAYPLFISLLKAVAPLWGVETSFARLELWSLLNEKVLASPWLGYGIEGSRFLSFDLSATRYLTAHAAVFHPHNTVLQIWVEFGLMGVLVSLYFLWLLWRFFCRLDTTAQKATLAMLGGWLIIALTGYNMWQPWLIAATAQSGFFAIFGKFADKKII